MTADSKSPIPDSQGFLEAKEWLGKRTCGLRYPGMSVDWDASKAWCQLWINDSWSVLVAMLGEESARMFLMSKYDTVKGGRNG